MARKEMPYTLPANLDENDHGSALAMFLQENTGTIFGTWRGTMKVADQRRLFGRKIGKGRICIDGDREWVQMSISMCFGTMRDTVFESTWASLDTAARVAVQ